MSGTTIGRVAIPLFPVGNGADLLMSLCADNGGVPRTVVTQTRLPASWIARLSAVSVPVIPAAQTSGTFTAYTGNPLAVAQFNAFQMGAYSRQTWSYPTSGTGGPAANPTSVYYDTGTGTGYYVQMGGNDGSTFFVDVYMIPCIGSTSSVRPSTPTGSCA